MKTLPVFLGLLALATATKISYKNYKVFEVIVESEEQSRFLHDLSEKIDLDFWSRLRKKGIVNILVAPNVEAKFTSALKSRNLDHSIKYSDVQELVDASKMVTKDEGGDHGMDWDNFHDLDTMYAWFDHLEAKYGEVTTEVIGQSYDGQDMRVIKICTGACGNKPAMYIQGGIHAREWISPAVVTYMIRELTDFAENNTDVVQNLDWYILPVTNPDGYLYTQTDNRLWRKTRSPNEGNDCVGTDANRNFELGFGGLGTSNNPCSDIYHGSFPYSEIETANVRDFVMKHKDQIKFFNDVHAAASMALFPWGYTDELTEDHEALMDVFTRAAEALFNVHGYVYEVGTVYDVIYPASGITVDFAYGTAGIPYVTTIELRAEDGFTPPPENIILEGEEVWAFHKSIAYDIIDQFGA